METILKAREESLNGYLALVNGKLNIPYTQRPYEWNKTQITRLFNDILAVYEKRQNQHILNFITIYKDDDGLNIYDGQQRTVSLLIIICALVNKLKKLGKSEAAQKITSEYICKEDWRGADSIEYKVNFQSHDTNEFFREYIVNGNMNMSDLELTDYEKHLKENYDIIVQLIGAYKADITSHEIIKIVQSLTDNFFVIVLETQNEEVANQMFETLNNTGKKLADFYVLKNNCVKLIGEEATSSYWNEIESNTDGLNKSKFLMQFVSIYNGKTSEKNAYNSLEKNKNISTKILALKTLQEMKKASLCYLELSEPKQKRLGNKEELKHFEDLVEALKIFKAEQYRPIIMAMELRDYDLEEINTILFAALKIQIRNICIFQEKANTLEKFYPELANNIYSSKEKMSISIIQETINKKMKSNLEITDRLKNRIFKSTIENQQIRYLLREIYSHQNKNEVKISSSVHDVTLEHILPKNPETHSQWLKTFPNDEERVKYTYQLGNLTLILGRKNGSASNNDFDIKKEIYQESTIIQNKDLGKHKTWTQNEIITRTQNLTDLLLEIW
ncbi:DUF262 domain-containing HNH endonuclease family protein [Bacillus wiedmannii]|uniref:DUF262 domain-containing protein n=1 Tax=Bacillus wiedmannii TaxID=1890302 RepID=UPI002E1B9DC5|nr:DUF262 domain-containing HNH endonuclease family protein [Bacillus wiedmannii]